MKKKISLIILCGILLLGVCGCEKNNENNETKVSNTDTTKISNTNTDVEQKVEENLTPNYTITSIEGIGNVYKFGRKNSYGQCRVDNFTARIEESALDNMLDLEYTITMTKLKKHDTYSSCELKIAVYDSDNVVVGYYFPYLSAELNETVRVTGHIIIDKSGTDYKIKLIESI